MQASIRERLADALSPGAIFELKHRAQQAIVWRRGLARTFARATPEASPLGVDALRSLDLEFPAPSAAEVDSDWTEDAIEARATRRIQRLSSLLGEEWERVDEVLETGVGDGVMSRIMASRNGKRVTANDHQRDELRDDVEAAGVEFLQASASALPIEDARYDLVISYDAFEHFDDPASAYHETIRVLRPGGCVYLRFGPLYRSATGLHAGERLGVPYAPVLFERDVIDAYLADEGREPLYHHYCNEWTLSGFRDLFRSMPEEARPVRWFEHMDLAGLELISRYPGVFKRCSDDLDDFLVSYLEIVVRKL